MPTEGFEKSNLYFKSKDDEEYKELGTGEVEFSSIEEGKNSEFNEMEEIYNETGFTAELEIKLKKYSKKRFKKLLMAQGIQRNDAEIFASIAGDKKSWIHRNDFGLMITTSIVTAWRVNKPVWDDKRKKWRVLDYYCREQNTFYVSFSDTNNREKFEEKELYFKERDEIDDK